MAVGLSSQLLESLAPGRVAALIVVFTVGSFIVDFTWKPQYPKSLPRVGSADGFLDTIKNWFYFVTRYNAWVAEGYDKVYRRPSRLAPPPRCFPMF